MAMKLSEFPPMVRDGRVLYAVKPGTTSTPGNEIWDRVYDWAHVMRKFDDYGDWGIRETSKGSACRGTVVASIKGPRGTVEAWNGYDVYFIPKGVKPSKEPDWKEIDEANGIKFWPEPSLKDCEWVRHGKCAHYEKDGMPAYQWFRSEFVRAIAEACDLAGLIKQERLPL